MPDAPLGAVAPGAKVFVRYADAAAVPPPPGDALHVVDQRVVQNMMPGSPELAVVRTIWLEDPGEATDLWADALVTREVRMKPPFCLNPLRRLQRDPPAVARPDGPA